MIILNRGLLALLLSLPAGAGLAQETPPLALSSSVEAGWTSNAEGVAGGGGSTYLLNSHAVTLAGGDANADLRASFGLEQTRYFALAELDDWLARLSLEADIGLNADTRLRGRFALDYESQGNLLATDAGLLGTRAPTLTGDAAVRIERLAGATLLGLSLGYDAVRPGETQIEADVLAPARTAANTDTISAGFDIAHPVAANAALSGTLEWRGVLVEADEQSAFGRLPSHHLRGAIGFEIGDGRGTALALRGGIDALVAGIEGIEPIHLPYARAEGSLAFLPNLALRASLSAGADTADPADGYADWLLAARAGVEWATVPDLALQAAVFTNQRRSPALRTTIETEVGVSVQASYRLAGLELGAKLTHRRVTGLATPYEETRMGMRVSANL